MSAQLDLDCEYQDRLFDWMEPDWHEPLDEALRRIELLLDERPIDDDPILWPTAEAEVEKIYRDWGYRPAAPLLWRVRTTIAEYLRHD